MYFEYALEPDLVAACCDGQRGNILKRFGMKHQRVVSRFPDHWDKLFNEAFKRLFPSPTFNQTKRFGELKSQWDKQRKAKRKSAYDPQYPWIANASKEHAIKPFYSILATTNPESQPSIIVIPDDSDIEDILIEHDNHVKVRRLPTEMAKTIEPVLRVARHIVFIDPYFKATNPRFSETFKAFMDIVAARSDKHLVAVELHTGIEREFKDREPRDVTLEKNYADEIFDGFQKSKKHILPDGIALRVVIWKERDKGESLHNRYVLTELGGIMVGYGLDKEKFDRVQFDDFVCLNSEESYRDRWNDYLGGSPAFDPVLDKRM